MADCPKSDELPKYEAPPSYGAVNVQQPMTYQPPNQYQPMINGVPQAAVVTTTIDMSATNTANTQLYPESAALYNDMVAKFGAHNVKPIPDFITTEKLRKRWCKSNENALLYTLYRKDHYLEDIQQMIDAPLCCSWCAFKPPTKYPQPYTPGGVCFVETLSYCCCVWVTLPDLRTMMYSEIKADHTNICCPVCCGGIAFRQVFVKRLKKSGIKISENSCWSCLMITCCQPCVAIQTSNVMFYTYVKRYGAARSPNDLIREAAEESPEYRKYLEYCKDNIQHPYSRSQIVQYTRTGPISNVTSRERTSANKTPVNDLFFEFYKPQEAIKQHNRYWKGIHEIKMEGNGP